jgi:hypothetical protein
LSTPQRLGLYAFSVNDPVEFTDASGLQDCDTPGGDCRGFIDWTIGGDSGGGSGLRTPTQWQSTAIGPQGIAPVSPLGPFSNIPFIKGGSSSFFQNSVPLPIFKPFYLKIWDLGNVTSEANARTIMAKLIQAPNIFFPFSVVPLTPSTGITLGGLYDLQDTRFPGDKWNWIQVSSVTDTSFTFTTLPGHFRGPWEEISFYTFEGAGRVFLAQIGTEDGSFMGDIYTWASTATWATQAQNLQNSFYGLAGVDAGARIPLFSGSFPAGFLLKP